ncbi:hypothetical protein N656DRAFT_700887 [Canariomyces notabilis]|uniref:Rhodopsin family protein n=1 Tax=Canariomyces notabilis TaxID=2074819 RepID=A0AAN6TLS3_9PEZI|nr:hypothetical protein N656DRAFT_700887 [Canariomyces arenarius]
MFFIFTCGEHTFHKPVQGYEGLVCRCYNCGNYSAAVIKSHPWFTFCFVPVLPLSMKGYEDVSCRICNFQQPLSHRPDVRALRGGGQGAQMQPPQHAPPQGWGTGQPNPNEPMRYS